MAWENHQWKIVVNSKTDTNQFIHQERKRCYNGHTLKKTASNLNVEALTLIPIDREGGRVKVLGVYGVGKKREMIAAR